MKILPSLLAAPSLELHRSIEAMLTLGLTHFHIDMMDYQFTPNFGLSLDLCRAILQTFPEASLDVHLMTNPTQPALVDALLEMGITDITVHLNTLSQDQIKTLSKTPSIRLRVALSHHDQLDQVMQQEKFTLLKPKRLLILAVTPGFCGQKMQPTALALTQKANQLGFDTMLDGGVNLDSCHDVKVSQPNSVVVGGGLFNQPHDKQTALISQLMGPQD